MQITKTRWNQYRAYGVSRGLSLENAEDFAQEVAIRCHREGREPSLNWVYVDYMRRVFGRPGRSPKHGVIFCELGEARTCQTPEFFDFEKLIRLAVDEIKAARIYHPQTVERLAWYFRVSADEMRAMLRAL